MTRIVFRIFLPWATLNQWCKAHLKTRILSLKCLKDLNGALSKATLIAFDAIQHLLDPLGIKKQHGNAWFWFITTVLVPENAGTKAQLPKIGVTGKHWVC